MDRRDHVVSFLERTFTFQDYLKLYPSFMDRIDAIMTYIPDDLKDAIDQYITVLESSEGNNRRLQTALDLTQAEASLVLLLVNGDSLADIATKRGVSRHTVRNQLQNIYQKNHINRLPALINLATKTLSA